MSVQVMGGLSQVAVDSKEQLTLRTAALGPAGAGVGLLSAADGWPALNEGKSDCPSKLAAANGAAVGEAVFAGTSAWSTGDKDGVDDMLCGWACRKHAASAGRSSYTHNFALDRHLRTSPLAPCLGLCSTLLEFNFGVREMLAGRASKLAFWSDGSRSRPTPTRRVIFFLRCALPTPAAAFAYLAMPSKIHSSD